MSSDEKPLTPSPTGIDPAAVVKLVVGLQSTGVDEDKIRAVLGDAAWTSLVDVAAAYGVSHATVKHTWRASGMPGDGKKKIFPMADGLIWWLRRSATVAEGRGATADTTRKRAADAIRAEIEAKRAQRAFDMEQGKFQSVAILSSQWNAALAVLSNGIMGIPRIMKPALCKRCAESGGLEVERLLRNELKRISDRPIEDVLPEERNGHAP